MATNKRKEAAALFELIDKSTLKVPKNAGALKIPSWWSSKTNPTPPAPAAPASPKPSPSPLARTAAQPVAPASPPSPPAPPTAASPAVAPSVAPVAEAPAPAAPEASPPPVPYTTGHSLNGHANGHSVTAEPAKPEAQPRLFQPPPANTTPTVTPSIRPPARSPITPSVPVRAPAPVEPMETPPEPAAKDTLPIAEEELADVAEPVIERRPLAPPTGSPAAGTSRTWTPADRNTFVNVLANVPPMALAGAGAVVLLLLILILYLATRHHGGTPVTPPQNSVETSITGPGGTPSPVAPQQGTPSNSSLLGPPPQQAQGDNASQALPPVAPGMGRVYEPGAYRFAPDSLYVFIATSKSESVTRRNAKFVAEHGVDVAIEKSKDDFYLIAAQPYPNNVAAETMVKKIREIGKLHPDYRSTRKVFADAVARRVVIGGSGGR
jgi:hypothetical protein